MRKGYSPPTLNRSGRSLSEISRQIRMSHDIPTNTYTLVFSWDFLAYPYDPSPIRCTKYRIYRISKPTFDHILAAHTPDKTYYSWGSCYVFNRHVIPL